MADRDGGRGPDGDTLPSPGALAAAARQVLEAHWRGRFCVPNPSTYPWQWLWDSCFHAVAWAHLGDDRAVVELSSVFDVQQPSGFVPHIDYRGDDRHDRFWGRHATSCLTQPPMYGHAVAVLIELGFDVPSEVVEAARRGLLHLLSGRPRHGSGLVAVMHPWETGADDSPRWDDWRPDGGGRRTWFDVKGDLVSSIEFDDDGDPRRNPDFDVAAAGFNALVAFNALELAAVVGDTELGAEGGALAEAVGARWHEPLTTWVDAGPHERRSGRVRTLDALLPALVVAPAAARPALDAVVDRRGFGGDCGPPGVDRREPTFRPDAYWRGPAWPQLTYLLIVGARRQGRGELADRLATMLVTGAVRSGFAEYWDPDTGQALGARPQSWAALAAAVGFN